MLVKHSGPPHARQEVLDLDVELARLPPKNRALVGLSASEDPPGMFWVGMESENRGWIGEWTHAAHAFILAGHGVGPEIHLAVLSGREKVQVS